AFAAGERLDSCTLCGNAESAAALLGCADSQVGNGVHVGSCDPGRHCGACLGCVSMSSTVVEPYTYTVCLNSYRSSAALGGPPRRGLERLPLLASRWKTLDMSSICAGGRSEGPRSPERGAGSEERGRTGGSFTLHVHRVIDNQKLHVTGA